MDETAFEVCGGERMTDHATKIAEEIVDLSAYTDDDVG